MEISSDNATMHAGGSINSNNALSFQGRSVHHHVHNYQAQAGGRMPAKPLLRCPLPSPSFVGRKKELRRLKEFFASADLDLRRFALIGMGGCGKSQVASEFTHKVILTEKIYDPSMVFFIDGTSTTTLEESYASIAQSKGVGLTAQDALSWLSSSNIQGPSFILIDNVDSAILDLGAYMPRSLNAHILITTRLHDKGRQYASSSDAFIDLEDLPTEDAEELLVKSAMLRPEDMKETAVLVQELCCYALAIVQAGACISFLRLAVSEYLERFHLLGTSLMDGKNDGVSSSALHGYSKVVRYTWELSYNQLPAASKDLFNLCAFLHHTGITKEVFQKATKALEIFEPTVPFSAAEEAAFAVLTKALEPCQGDDGFFDIFAWGRCIGPVLSLSLMRCDPITRVHSIHPFILDSLQHVVSDHFPTSLLLMLAITADLEDTPFLYHLLPHVDSVMRRFTTEFEGSSHPDQCHPDILSAFSYVYSETRRHKEVEKMRLNVLSQRRCLLGEDHRDTLCAMHRLAKSWSVLGRHEEAEKMRMEVLSRHRRLLGEDDPLTMWAMNDLANSWSDLGKHSEAEEMCMVVLSRRRRLLGEEHPDTVSAMNNLANSWSHLGKHKEAEEMCLDVLSRRRRLLGDNHPDTVTAMNNLANSWSALGRHKEAEKMRLDILSRYTCLLGEDHPDTVWAVNDLADSWSRLGRHEEAEQMRLEVLSRRRRLLGENHPDTLWAMGKLANTFSKLGRHEEAEKMRLDVLSCRLRLLGEDDPDTLLAMADLARTWSRLRRHGEAEKLRRNILSRRRCLLGEDHPDTVTAMVDLARTWSRLGRYEEAAKMQRDVLSRTKRLQGEDHLGTVNIMVDSALTLASLQCHHESEKLCEEGLKQRRRILGEEHSDTVCSSQLLTWISARRELRHFATRVIPFVPLVLVPILILARRR